MVAPRVHVPRTVKNMVTAALVKELRERSGAGMSACKDALVEANGDLDRASEILREKGLAAAAKKAGRIASEGLVKCIVAADQKTGAVVEVNSETDFVAKNQDFIDYVTQVAELALTSNATDMDAFMAQPWPHAAGESVQEALNHKIAIIGENVGIRRFTRYTAGENGVIVNYTHGGGRVTVMLEMASTVVNDALLEAGRNMCMQAAAMSPQFVSQKDISEEFITQEKAILVQQAVNEGKAANIAEKVVEGRLRKSLSAMCLMDQEYVKDGEFTCAQYMEAVGKELGAPVSVVRFVRYETGEGIEKKEEDFAEEVMKAMGN